MTATCRFEIDQLLQPIPGPQPAGDSRAYAHRLHEQFNELRREDDPTDFDEATRPAEFKKADWDSALELGENTLLAESKDIRVACHLIEALVQLDGFDGLEQGITLLRRLCEDCWDRLIPALEDDDPDTRSAPLANMLDDPVRGLCFPNLIRRLPILGRESTATSFLAWNQLQSSGDSGRRDAVLSSTDVDQLEKLAVGAQACLDELQALRSVLDDKLGNHAPGLLHLGEAVNDCCTLARNALRQLRPELDPQCEGGDTSGEATSELQTAAGSDAVGVTASRRAIYEQIEQAANALSRLEPHSPVPYLVKRAVELGRLPFPQMIRQFVREENTLNEMYRELGIEAPADDPAGVS